MTGENIAIETRRLTKAFAASVVLNRVDLAVPEGQSVALTGANGAGKTTLLRCLAALLRPTRGEVRWFGQPVATNLRSVPGVAARRMVGMVAHESFLYPHLTVRENLLFAARMWGVAQPRELADQWLRRTGLAVCAQRPPTRISRGMRQRLAVARALLHQPRILLLDEPFSGLDADGSEWLIELLGELRDRPTTICFATHDRQMVCRLADRVFHVQSGKVVHRAARGGDPALERSRRRRAA